MYPSSFDVLRNKFYKVNSYFDITSAIEKLCIDLCMRLPVFVHIKMDQVGISARQARQNEPYGVFASVTPLRFEGGTRVFKRQDRYYCLPEITGHNGKPLLYILSVLLPRFQEQTFHDKLVTIVHELYHIGPAFNGDIRRFKGRCYVHGTSQDKYNQVMRQYVDEWLKKEPPPEVWDFLKLSFQELKDRYGNIRGTRYGCIKLRPVSGETAAQLLQNE